ncbi:hypothetical protein AgCh_018256 [Apium graveolens]
MTAKSDTESSNFDDDSNTDIESDVDSDHNNNKDMDQMVALLVESFKKMKQLKQKLKDLHMKDKRKRSRKNRNCKGNRRNALVLDSGCSGHMTGYKSLLSEFEEKVGPSVSYGDGNLGKILGYGKIKVGNVIIENVALVAGLKHNLISVSQICDRGYHVNFYEEHCEIVSKSDGRSH